MTKGDHIQASAKTYPPQRRTVHENELATRDAVHHSSGCEGGIVVVVKNTPEATTDNIIGLETRISEYRRRETAWQKALRAEIRRSSEPRP
jgi:hypothetical protein